jgi:DNA-binding transcriptional ArsR family regulator
MILYNQAMQTDRSIQLLALLRKGVISAAELEKTLDLSQSAVSRLLRALIAEGQVIRLGSTRGARYGLLRAIGNIGSRWQLRQIDAAGNVQLVGQLHALASNEYFFLPSNVTYSPLGTVTDGIPYFLQDQRPGGFLGRAVPHRFPELGLPQRVVDWTDDHYLQY